MFKKVQVQVIFLIFSPPLWIERRNVPHGVRVVHKRKEENKLYLGNFF